jgi:hypothetical protein
VEPPQRADLQVSAWVSPDLHGHAQVFARVSGVPRGESVRLHVATSSGDLHSLPGNGCSRAGSRSYDCTTGSDRAFAFLVHSRSRPTLTFSVQPPSGWTDPASGNNTASVTVPRGLLPND